MNKVIASTGLVALSAASLQAASFYAPEPELPKHKREKPWSVSATLRGFYDSNYTTSSTKRDSFGFEVGPSISFNQALEQTYFEIGYDYRGRWYEDGARDEAWDHTHRFNLGVNHEFTENFGASLDESLVIAQEPDVIAGDGPLATPLRSEQDVLRNRASLDFDATLTRQLGTQFGYRNTFVEYDQEGDGSFSSLLDRVEHRAHADLRWQALPNTTPLVGYQFEIVDYTSDDPVFPGSPVEASDRNRRSHFVFVGVDQQLLGTLRGSARVGAQFVKFPNAPSGVDDSDVGPYADANLTYNYLPGSSLRVGLRHERVPTDIAILTLGDDPVLEQEATTLYGVLSHSLTDKLTARLNGQAQFSEFKQGALDGEEDDLFLFGANLNYQWTPNFSTEAGYNFDKLNSDITNRSFKRSRYYLGVTATY